jgi:predicted transcriptional regulator
MRTVRDIMESDVFWIPSDMPLERAAKELASRQVSGAPVCAPDGRLIGMLSSTDLTEFYGGAHELRLARDVMTPEVLAVAPDDPIEQAIKLMAFEGVHRLVVVDLEHRLHGIVTSMDVLRELAGFPRQPPRVFAVAPPL